MTVTEWHQMTASGTGTLLRELLDGEVVDKAPVSTAHADCVVRLQGVIESAVGDLGLVQMHLPVVLDDWSEPRPDISVLARPGESTGSHPTILLVIEVADSSQDLIYSRGRKAAYYARSGVPDCWIVDLMSKQVLAHSSAASGGYRDIRNLREAAKLTVTSMPGVTVSAGDIFSD